MLQYSSVQRRISQPYVCWQCVSRLQRSAPRRGFGAVARIRAGSVPVRAQAQQRWFTEGRTRLATVNLSANNAATVQSPSGLLGEGNIRERLKRWEIENAADYIPQPTGDVDHKPPGAVRNALTSTPMGELGLEMPEEKEEGEELIDHQKGDEYIDLGARRVFFRRGDLVELSGRGSVQQILAIFVKELDSQSQIFYTSSGSWAIRDATLPAFSVPNFVPPEAVEGILPFVPSVEDVLECQNSDRKRLVNPPRWSAQSLLEKLNDFLSQANKVHEKNAPTLENAHSLLATEKSFIFLTLEEMADRLLPKYKSRNKDGINPYAVRYALHRAIFYDNIGFTAPRFDNLRMGGVYELCPKIVVDNVVEVTQLVRKYRQDRTASKPLANFIAKAQQLIDVSRKSRDFTPHGTVGPCKTPSNHSPYRLGHEQQDWTKEDNKIIQFLESWVSLDLFNPYSFLHGIGSEILRYTGRYPDVLLDQRTGWTFLQEIGAQPPWENRSMYTLRLPGTGTRLPFVPTPTEKDNHGMVEDKVKHIRRDWGDLRVFCIDSISANELDDGLSIEATENPDEYWVHVHTADPASMMESKGQAMQYAERMITSSYLPDRITPMLNAEPGFIKEKLSLGPNRPCLTYSMKVKTTGEISDSYISAGTVHNVVCVEPSVIQEVMEGEAPREFAKFTVGSDSFTATQREMLQPSEIDGDLRKELFDIGHLALARQKYMATKGAITTDSLSQGLSVSFGGVGYQRINPQRSCRYDGDPKIEISTEMTTGDKPQRLQRNLVMPFMVAAGEVAARWCNARGIPIVYRVTPHNPDREGPASVFQRVVKPIMDELGRAPLKAMIEYINTTGRVLPSTEAGAHATLGGILYTKVTSPLRRFPDLLAQQQIEAALLEEARLGESLVGSTRTDYLPFSKDRVNALIPHIFTREKLDSMCNLNAIRSWQAHLLLRAWKFGEGKLPSPLILESKSSLLRGQYIVGWLHGLYIQGTMNVPDWMTDRNIQEGDKFEVEIADIDIYNHRVSFDPLRKVQV